MENPLKRFDVVIVGAGYVGLVTGATLSHLGHRVTCVDRDEERIRALKSGRLPFYEPNLEELVSLGVSAERLSFVDPAGLAGLIGETDVLFIAVDTPQNGDGSANLSSVAAIARDIGRSLSGAPLRKCPLLVVNKSTVPVGSGDYVSMLIQEGLEEAEGGKARGASFLVASNPEFLREGSACYDSFFPDRIVVGANSREAMDTLRALYEPIIAQSFPTKLDPRPKVAVPFVTTDPASAEMIKYAANAFLATKISFVNEISNLCELVGADVSEVAYGIGLDGRIGPRFLSAGIGWGGSCLPKDVAALRAVAREYGYEPILLDAGVAVNARQRKRIVVKLQRELQTLKGKRIALLGLAFKPNTDDLRESPSLEIARALHTLGTRTVGYDPVAGKAAARLVPELRVVFGPRPLQRALRGAHAAVVITEWDEVRGLKPKRAASLMREAKLLVDGRNALDPSSSWRRAGLLYRGLGRR
jgi:UDPglucose 6-dehydrogenase